MYIKPGTRLLVINPPAGYMEQLSPLPEGAIVETSPSGSYDAVQVFMKNQSEVDQYSAQAMAAVKPGGALWMCYPKGTGKLKSDINRDKGWDIINNAGWGGVRLISIDDTWSALMFRQESQIARKADSKATSQGTKNKKS